jgi:hypothetical protein
MRRSFEMTLECNEVFVTFYLIVENDLFNSRDVDVEFETYGPLFRDDCYHREIDQIDAKILEELRDNGRLEQMLDEMEFDSLKETFEHKA